MCHYILLSAFLCSPGGSGQSQRSQTSGLTASMIMTHRPGCVPLPRKAVSDRACACTFWFVFLHSSVWLDFFFFFLHLPWTLKKSLSLTSFSPRLAAVGAGPHDPLCGLLLHFLPGVPGSAAHPDKGRTLLLHRALPRLRRSLQKCSIC